MNTAIYDSRVHRLLAWAARVRGEGRAMDTADRRLTARARRLVAEADLPLEVLGVLRCDGLPVLAVRGPAPAAARLEGLLRRWGGRAVPVVVDDIRPITRG